MRALASIVGHPRKQFVGLPTSLHSDEAHSETVEVLPLDCCFGCLQVGWEIVPRQVICHVPLLLARLLFDLLIVVTAVLAFSGGLYPGFDGRWEGSAAIRGR
ncbi:MAG: hypothetical protein WAN93_03740 [Solirubrobacteraceae bacterium]